MRIWNKKFNSKCKNRDMIDKILMYNNVNLAKKEEFLNASVDDLYDFRDVFSVRNAMNLIQDTIDKKETICIYTDYDVDGIGGGSVAYLMLKELGADVFVFTSDKRTEGYGMNEAGVERLSKHEKFDKTSLIITVDNGIAAVDGIKKAVSLGKKVIVTDHHEPDRDIVLDTDIVVDLKQGYDSYPFSELCGCGVVWKLLREMFREKGMLDEANKYLDIVALSTISDLVPLVSENRIIVKEGLKLMNEGNRPFFRLFKETAPNIEKYDETVIGFNVGPVLNAKTRIEAKVDNVIKLFTHPENEYEMIELIRELIHLNDVRKEKEKKQVQIALDIIEKEKLEEDKLLILCDSRFDGGIMGLVAGKLAEMYSRPVLVSTVKKDNKASGSMRTYGDFNVHAYLKRMSPYLINYGGHRAAGGLQFEYDKLEDLREATRKDVVVRDFVGKKEYTYMEELAPEEVTEELIDTINELAPYGIGFERPVFALTNIEKGYPFFMGEDEHIKIKTDTVNIVCFNAPKLVEGIKKDSAEEKYHILVSLDYNYFRGNKSIQGIVHRGNLLRVKSLVS